MLFSSRKIIALLLCSCTALSTAGPTHRRRAGLPVPDRSVAQATAQLPVAPEGWLEGVRAEAVEPPAIVTDLLSTARKLIGSRYRRGSSGPGAFDCSGFTSYVFSRSGIQLKRSSREQYTQGTAVATIADLVPGDLVFFGHHGRRASSVNHVGIVTAVDAASGAFEFIHSSSSKGVRVDCYPDAAYWKTHYQGARRVIE